MPGDPIHSSAARRHEADTIHTTAVHTLAALAATLTLVVGLTAPSAARAASSTADRRAAGAGAPSAYLDPCEHTPAGTTPSPVDVRELVVDDPFRSDDRTVDDTEAVEVRFRLCRTLDTAGAPPLRVDLHRRIDGVGGADTDYAEDPSRWLVFLPPPGAGGWTWELYRSDGADGTVVATGEVRLTGSPDAITELAADVPAQLLRAAGDPDTSSATGLPAVALRACTHGGDCGPGYQQHPDGSATVSSDRGLATVDYLPEPRHLPLTYPSLCQHGPAPSAGRAGPGARPVVDGAVTAPAQVTVDARTAGQLVARGWTRLTRLPDGRAVFRGSPESVRAIAPDASIGTVTLRRARVEPDDPYYPAGGPRAPTGQWSLRRIGAAQGWDATTGRSDVLVAVLDSGFDGLHPDLAGRAVAGRDYVQTRLTTPRPLDVTTDTDFGGHGSFVASLIAARTDDGSGMAGLGWRTQLLVARVFDAESCASDAALHDAIGWATKLGAVAVNLSLGGPEPSSGLLVAGEAAVAAGTIPVAAAGNTGGSVKDYPAYYDPYLSVTATGYAEPGSTAEDPLAGYASRNDGIDLAAPGGSGSPDAHNVLGACWQGPAAERGWCRRAGTSFSTPLVSAAIALVRSLDPGRTVEGVRQLLADTARDLTACAGCTTGPDASTGSGRLDVGKALTWLRSRTETLRTVGLDSDATGGSVAASQSLFEAGAASAVLVARNDVFADALAGAPLAGSQGPILLTPPAQLDERAARELRRVLPQGATVTLLGGPEALHPGVEQAIEDLGYVTTRLAGATRIGTAIAVADRVVRGPGGQVLVASASNWPDAVSGGAYAAAAGVPLLLTWPHAADDAHSPGFLDALVSYQPGEVVILGGPMAVSDHARQQIDQRVGATRRVAGIDRNETATRIVTELWRRTRGHDGDRYTIIDGWRPDGWAYGLSASPSAAANRAPLLLVDAGLTHDQPRRLLRDALGYRLPAPAYGIFFGPLGGTTATRASTLDRLGELLGG